MLRLAGWRLALAASPLLLEKGKTGRMLTESTASQPAARQIGTVISFMHRRGYGFIRELEMTPAKSKGSDVSDATEAPPLSNDGRGFFFPRSSLDGGFYVTPGQTVAFNVRLMQPSKGLKERLSEGGALTAEEAVVGGPSKELSVAHHIRLYDPVSGKERSVSPIMLLGYVENWDALAGTGVIAELDLSGELHDDAPRFSVSLEDLDLSGRTELGRGRYVRFCVEPGNRTAARRVIIDRALERKRREQRHAATEEGAYDDAGGLRHYGTVRETVEGRFGFIVVDETGESIFFHMSNAEGGAVKPGDTVSFVLREVSQGKHTGKKTCMSVQKCTTRSPTSTSKTAAGAGAGHKSKSTHDLGDDDEFDLLD